MDSIFRPTRVEISLDALTHNVAQFRRHLPPDMKLMGVVKANAYGHGAVPIARELQSLGVDALCVAILDEGLELRKHGVHVPIIVMGYTPAEGLRLAAEHDIALSMYDPALLNEAENITLPRPLRVHVKIDSGMGRIGLHEKEQAIRFIDQALSNPALEVEGLFTHYASADDRDKTATHGQHARFNEIVSHYARQDIHFPWIHAGNSATAIDTPELSFNAVRIGVSLYGMYPSQEVDRTNVHLLPVMTYKSGVSMVKVLPKGSGISYGSTYVTQTDEQIVTIPVGYGDGYSRMLSHQAHVLLHGQKIPVVGNICMDQCMANASGLSHIQMGDEVVLFGSQQDASIPVEEIADHLGTINYEVTCMVSNRVPRVYIRQGQIDQIVNPLLH
ncbi:alanine racemase [Marinicrinis sediminis]|uniref:Alanine racemase n=1 Tax=Marinicrinis sediminis TaxID=1652465 RepID=A0ABW5R9L0_9BACL